MGDTRLLIDSFNRYYQRGIELLKKEDYDNACRELFNAAETWLKVAKESTGTLKAQRLKRAEEICNLAKEIKKNKVSKSLKEIEGMNPVEEENVKFKSTTKNSKIKFEDVAGLQEVKDEIKKSIIDPQKYPDLYKKFKKKKGGGLLLYGPPGTGKTMIAKAIANEIDAEFYSVKCSDIFSKWVGDSEKNIHALFQEARRHPCSVIFFDEFEAIGAKRDINSVHMKKFIPQFLAEIDGFESNENTLILMGSTNRPWDIDSAFLRPGRFNKSIGIPLPDYDARKSIVKKQLSGIPVEENLDYEKIVNLTEGYSGADVTEFCERIKDCAIDRSIANSTESPINNGDIEETSKMVKSSVRDEDLKKIREYEMKINKIN